MQAVRNDSNLGSLKGKAWLYTHHVMDDGREHKMTKRREQHWRKTEKAGSHRCLVSASKAFKTTHPAPHSIPQRILCPLHTFPIWVPYPPNVSKKHQFTNDSNLDTTVYQPFLILAPIRSSNFTLNLFPNLLLIFPSSPRLNNGILSPQPILRPPLPLPYPCLRSLHHNASQTPLRESPTSPLLVPHFA